MATPATPITFTLANNTVNQMSIRSITYVDDSNITHHANYSNFDYGGSDNTDNTTAITRVKQYQTGDYLQRSFVSDTHDRTVYYSTHTGRTLTIKESTTEGLYAGWTADSLGDNAFDGLTISSIGGPTTIVLSGTPSIPLPAQGESIVFSISPNKITIDDTTGIYAGWQIRDNGYSTPATVISVVDSQTLIVSALPTNPTVGNTMLFTSSTNYLTVNNTTDIQAGWTAQTSDNAYDGSQYVVSVINGSTVKMSAQPNSAPSTSSPANQITFTSDQPLSTIDAGQAKTFILNYTNNNSTPVASLPSILTINAKNLSNNNSIIGHINNYVSINLPPPPPPVYTNNINGNGGGGGRGGDRGGDGGDGDFIILPRGALHGVSPRLSSFIFSCRQTRSF
jgi:hypothetical protein